MLLGGQLPSYKTMYEKFIPAAKKYLLFRPMTPADEDILMFGTVFKSAEGEPRYNRELQHLTCFTGGMLAIAGKIFNRPEDVVDGGKLADGCVWAYKSTVTGIMPETMSAVPCDNRTSCTWDSKKWWDAIAPEEPKESATQMILEKKLVPGFVGVQDARYLLRYILFLVPSFFLMKFTS